MLVAMVLAVLLVGAAAAAAQTSLEIVSTSAKYKPSTGEVEFKIVFNREPDFLATDAAGRQADSFQIFVVGDPDLPYPSNFDSIVRGEEIHSMPGLIPVRNASPPSGEAGSGGWGTIRGIVPYSLRSTGGRYVLSFSAPLSLISDQTGVRRIRYVVETYEFGALSDIVEGYIRLTKRVAGG